MDKNRIIKLAQEGKRTGNEYEIAQYKKGMLLSTAISLAISVILFIIEYLSTGSWNFGMIVVWVSIATVSDIFEGVKTGKKGLIIRGLFEVLMLIFAVLWFFKQVVFS